MEDEQKSPSMFKMVSTFTKEFSKYVRAGAPNVSPADYALRLDTCNGCEFLKKSSMRCGKCGCLLEHKAKWETSECPENKWPINNKDAKK